MHSRPFYGGYAQFGSNFLIDQLSYLFLVSFMLVRRKLSLVLINLIVLFFVFRPIGGCNNLFTVNQKNDELLQ